MEFIQCKREDDETGDKRTDTDSKGRFIIMIQKKWTVADAIVKELVEAGVDTIFGIVSIHNMPIYEALLEEGSIRMATARGESGAVNMADAYSRTTGKLGVVLTSTGAGAGNGAGSLTETWNSGTPLLHITGEADYNYIGKDLRYIHECKDQQKMMDGANKSSYLLRLPHQITPFMKTAIRDALEVPKGPVTVSIPTNFQAKIIPENQFIETTIEPQDMKITVPDKIIKAIASAKRPIVWTGDGIIHSGASEELLTLVEKIQPAVVTSESGKGAISEDHPLCIGNFAATPQFTELLEKSDLLVSIGVRFRETETAEGTLPLPENHIHIDLNPHAFNRNYDTKYGLIGDAKDVLQTINRELEEKEIQLDSSYVEEVKECRQAVRNDLIETIQPYGEFARVMNDQLPENTILVTDVTMHGYIWGNKLVDIHEPGTYLHMTGGGIGQGLPMAVGAKVAQPEKPVVLIAGDGGFMVNAGEMISAVQEDAPIIVLLFDDGGYGILQYYQDAAYGRQTAVHLKNPDFVMMAKSMGFEAEKAASINEFDKVLAKALSSNQSYMVVVDTDKIGDLKYEDSPEYIQSFRPHQ
ncbi:thiamine pyrophosphate-binding protein [Oceanobacillus jeddahense]|uniref:Thiamine pyrophosphate-binding protein n=1 Tax=Oceanobacillus jeddahense TaxID=1462527 RepID=A0ABY5JYG6_9BACI|nr:thiamine pyrophosphate-binding protein [Oceanobacillus jeddahense]UUI05144.1 thiamine pyrophosphate-binding protein [Oceanobacillus jeddahense]